MGAALHAALSDDPSVSRGQPITSYIWHGDSAHFQVPLHWHDEIELLRLERGNCHYQSAGRRFVVPAPALIVVPGGCLHGFTMPDCGCEQVVIFDPQLLLLKVPDRGQDYCRRMLCADNLREVILNPQTEYFAEIFALTGSVAQRALQPEALDDAAFLLLKADLIRVAALLCSSNCLQAARISAGSYRREQEERIKKLITYVAGHYPYPIGIEDAARACALSPNYLSEYFSRTLNLTFSEYLLFFRLKAASQLLLSTTLPVEQVALKCGFENKSYFYRRFKQVFGMTPRRHRTSRQTKRRARDAAEGSCRDHFQLQL